MIDQAQLCLAGVHGVEDEGVLLVGLHIVGDHALEPLPGHLVSLGDPHRGDEGLEGRIGRCDGDLSLPLGIREIKDRLRHVSRRHLLSVVGDHTCASGDASPVTVGRAVVLRHRRLHRRRQRREEPRGIDSAERAGILSEEHLSGAGIALFEELGGQLSGIAVPRLDGDAGLLRELGEEGPDELLGPAGVNGEGAVCRVGAPAAGGQEGQGQRRGGEAEQRTPGTGQDHRELLR